MLLSHIELYVKNLTLMESFFTKVLGFVVTDRGKGEKDMVFLSRSPAEHHQIVLNPRESHHAVESPVDHISFRVDSLADLRSFYQSINSENSLTLQTVSHGSTWSLYFRDPENNRFEIFTDTPWYVNQPCKFEVDFTMTDDELISYTEDIVKTLPGFTIADDWLTSHQKSLLESK